MEGVFSKFHFNARLSNECSCSYQARYFLRTLRPFQKRKNVNCHRFPKFQAKQHRPVRIFTVCNNLKDDMAAGIRKGLCSIAAAAILCGPPASAAASDTDLTVAFPSSRAKEVNMVQRTLVEAWGIVRETFVDPTFNHQDWDMKLQQTMIEMLPLKTADAAYDKISNMLASLGDPFTRLISPKDYRSFRISNDGNVQGVGLFVSADPNSHTLRVVSSVDGSPAAQAGIHAGDELLEIDGIRCEGMNGEEAAQRLRGQIGSTIRIKIRNGQNSDWKLQTREVNLSRAKISLSPVSSSVILHKLPDGRLTKTGYVRLSSFSQSAAIDMKNAINDLEVQGVESYIMDLRNNPGGLVKAGLDVAQIWLDGNEPLSMQWTEMVNEGSASASEILAGALHDNGRAKLVGHKTFGKGKIQSVTELNDGSALFVTVANTSHQPDMTLIRWGILPDIQCTPEVLLTDKSESDSIITFKEAQNESSSMVPLENDFLRHGC